MGELGGLVGRAVHRVDLGDQRVVELVEDPATLLDVVAVEAYDEGLALLVAEDACGLCGTVQLVLDLPENQPHRADLVKMLVHRRARRQGLGAALLRAAENTALQCGKTLLLLDAVTGGDGARLYERMGWIRVGDVPGYALMPMGGFCSTTFYYRTLPRLE